MSIDPWQPGQPTRIDGPNTWLRGTAPTPAEREAEATTNRQARARLDAARHRRVIDEARDFELQRIEAEQQAKRDFDDYVRELAREIDKARQREVNSGTPTERMVRRQLEQEAFRDSVMRNARARERQRPTSASSGDSRSGAGVPQDPSHYVAHAFRAWADQSRNRRS